MTAAEFLATRTRVDSLAATDLGIEDETGPGYIYDRQFAIADYTIEDPFDPTMRYAVLLDDQAYFFPTLARAEAYLWTEYAQYLMN